MSLFDDIQQDALKQLDNVRKANEQELITAYATALKAVKEDMIKLHDKYAVDGVLSYAELQNYNRLQNIQKQIKDVLKDTTLTVNKSIINSIDKAYTLGTFYQAYGFDMALDMRGSWGLFNKDAVYESIVREQYLKEFLTDSRAKQIIALKDKITQKIIQGTYKKDLIEYIESVMGEGLASAENIATTEITAIYGRAQTAANQAARDQGIVLNEAWSSLGDSKRVRPVHKQEDGQYRQEDGLFHLSDGDTCTSPGNCKTAKNSCRCRCSIVVELSEYDIAYKPSISYEDWLAKYKK